jgi:hypothetical protein
MKIQFTDGSFVECKRSEDSDKIVLIISAKDYQNSLKRIDNAVELTAEEFKQLISDVDK